jgi:ribosomal protein L11 methyltransferase
MNYIEATLDVNPEFGEILVAELAELGFDTFLETETGIQAYSTEELFDAKAFKLLMEDYAEKTTLFYTLKTIEKQNWNAEWEQSFEPIQIGNQILVRADFHASQEGFTHEIIITPKMSFGTGHHETTSQVMELQLDVNHQNKTVLDVGTGTGILAILAEKLGAKQVRAFDIDEWSVENTEENLKLNNCEKTEVGLGTIADENHFVYDIVLANINRNILLSEIPVYTTFIKPGGNLLLSGFYEKDLPDIENVCNENGLKKQHSLSKKDWCAVVFVKQEV